MPESHTRETIALFTRKPDPDTVGGAYMKYILSVVSIPLCIGASAWAADTDLAKKLSNPVSDLISVPIQSNLDYGLGPGGGTKWTTNIQPVIPFSLSENWNIISRTILPVIEQQGIALGGSADEWGLGDVTQSFFLSPKSSDPIWGVGPAILFPTATDDVLGSEKWCLGPTAVLLKQSGHLTFGALVNHLWDVGGDEERNYVSATFLQPFVAYTTPHATTFTVNAESSYDWHSEQWTIPVNFVVSQVVKLGNQPMQLFAGARYYADKPDGGPDWGLRAGFTLLFPKG